MKSVRKVAFTATPVLKTSIFFPTPAPTPLCHHQQNPIPPRLRRARTVALPVAVAADSSRAVRVAIKPSAKVPARLLPEDASLCEFEVDAAGYEVSRGGARASKEILEAIGKGIQDVVIICHGWATARDEVDGYVKFNNDLAGALLAYDPRKDEDGRKVLLVGVVWPSHPATALAAVKGGKVSDSNNYAKLVAETNDLRDEKPAVYWRTVQAELQKTDPKAAAKLGEIVNEADDSLLAAINANPATIDSDPVSVENLPGKLRAKVTEFAQLLSPEAEEPGAKSEIDAAASETSSLLISTGKNLLKNSSIGGLFRSLSTVRGILNNGFLTLRSARDLVRPALSLLGILPSSRLIAGGKVVSRILERILFGQFQRRASNVGSRGVHLLLSQMMIAAEGKGTRFHLVGHSLGAHVVTSAAIGCPPGSLLPHKLHSLTMLQPAVPVPHYEKGGPYRPLSSQLLPVAGPVIATTSQSDMALYNMEIFDGEVVGRQGFHGLGSESDTVVLQNNVVTPLGFKKGVFYTVKGDAVINATSSVAFVDLDGSHGDLLDPPLQMRIWEAMNVTGVNDAELAIIPKSALPVDYWADDFTIRRNT